MESTTFELKLALLQEIIKLYPADITDDYHNRIRKLTIQLADELYEITK